MQIIDLALQLPRIAPVPQRPLAGIDGIAIHHSGDEGSPQGWARYHTTSPDNGGPSWGPGNSIGYHYAVMRDGTVYKTAQNSDQTPGVAKRNHHLLHVVCQGNFEKQPITGQQLQSLLDVCRHIMNAYPLIKADRVRSHKEWAVEGWGTACPGMPDLAPAVRLILRAGL